MTTTVFRQRRSLLYVYFLLGGLMILQGGLTAGYFYFVAGEEHGLTLIMVGISLFLVWAGYWFASKAWRRLRDAQNPITIGPAGLFDRMLSKRPIAWRDIRNLHVLATGRGGPIVVFDLAEGAEERAGIYPGARSAAVINRAFHYSYQVHHMGTDADPDQLVKAIAPFADVRPRS